MTDKNKASENGNRSPILPPKICERLRGDILPTVAKVREPELREIGRPESPKEKLKVSILRWLLIAISAIIFAFVLFGKPIKGCLSKSPSGRAEIAPEASSMPIRPIKARVSTPVPTDAEIDVAPVPPAGNDRSPSSTKI